MSGHKALVTSSRGMKRRAELDQFMLQYFVWKYHSLTACRYWGSIFQKNNSSSKSSKPLTIKLKSRTFVTKVHQLAVKRKFGFVALIVEPNVGKSSVLNCL